MSPKVSIIIPVYNIQEQTLQKCVDSLTQQTMRELEIIIVDDGSTSTCGKLCDSYAEKDNRIKVIHKQNGGLAAARNTGFDAATGETIMFVDGDDWIDTGCCERAYQTLVGENVQMTFFNIVYEYGKSSIKKTVFKNTEIKFDKKGCKKLQEHSLTHNSLIDQAYAKLIRRDFLQQHNIRHIDELSHGAESFIFSIALFNHLETACYIPDAMYHYRYNQQGITQTPDEKKYHLITRCLDYVDLYIKHCDNHETLEKKLLNRTLYITVMVAMTGYFSPTNKTTYRNKVSGFKRFLHEPIVMRALNTASWKGMNLQRRTVLVLIKLHCYPVIYWLGALRHRQLQKR